MFHITNVCFFFFPLSLVCGGKLWVVYVTPPPLNHPYKASETTLSSTIFSWQTISNTDSFKCTIVAPTCIVHKINVTLGHYLLVPCNQYRPKSFNLKSSNSHIFVTCNDCWDPQFLGRRHLAFVGEDKFMRGDCLLKLIMIKGTIGSKLPDRSKMTYVISPSRLLALTSR